MSFNEGDIHLLNKKGITLEDATNQVNNYVKGFPFAHLSKAATAEDGIRKLEQGKIDHYIQYFEDNYKDKTITKFVPASGAASRMFKEVFKFIDQPSLDSSIRATLEAYQDLAFAQDIERLAKEKNLDINTGSLEGLKNIASLIVTEQGLNYGALPKGYIKFHSYDGFERTAFEEHLVEGALYGKQHDDSVNLHFTISPEHKGLIKSFLADKIPSYEKEYNVKYNLSFSVQASQTDTIAVDLDNKPFRNHKDQLVFRPGGHGALIENLGMIDSDIIFVKNIDNVVPDRIKSATVNYKKVIAGYLIAMQAKAFDFLHQLEHNHDQELVKEAAAFCNERLGIHGDFLSKDVVVDVLNRPIRVCGMVKNEGEPGGGPFWVKKADGSESLQIIESTQIDMNNPHQSEVLKNATHFNPVDIVCGTKDYRGRSFDLKKYVDPSTGFISYKSKDGHEIKQQELPGLWNGAMAHWTTVFIEVPTITFNPVKTINDLRRPEHMK